jgi:hypothetical protein
VELSMGARIEDVELDAVAAGPRNPKRHDLSMLGASLDRFGFVAPCWSTRRRAGRLVAGQCPAGAPHAGSAGARPGRGRAVAHPRDSRHRLPG